jgi:hypothetical protein
VQRHGFEGPFADGVLQFRLGPARLVATILDTIVTAELNLARRRETEQLADGFPREIANRLKFRIRLNRRACLRLSAVVESAQA